MSTYENICELISEELDNPPDNFGGCYYQCPRVWPEDGNEIQAKLCELFGTEWLDKEDILLSDITHNTPLEEVTRYILRSIDKYTEKPAEDRSGCAYNCKNGYSAENIDNLLDSIKKSIEEQLSKSTVAQVATLAKKTVEE